MKNRDVSSKSNNYSCRAHLEDVVNNYRKVIAQEIAPFEGWYNFNIPEINLSLVRPHLLSVQEVAGRLGVSENSLRELLSKENVHCYFVGEKTLLNRSELNRMLAQFPLNGFREYSD